MVNQPKSVNISEDDVSNPVFRIMQAARFCNFANLSIFCLDVEPQVLEP